MEVECRLDIVHEVPAVPDERATQATEPPKCEVCQQLMMLARVVPRLGGLRELRTYRCTICKQVKTVEQP